MGLVGMPAGVTFWAGPFTHFGERVEHGLVVHYGTLDCVNDNAHRLEDMDFPDNDSIISFGSYRVYIAVVSDEYPDGVCSCDDLPSSYDDLSSDIDELYTHVEVMTIVSLAGASTYRTPIHAAVDTLRAPIPVVTDPASPTAEVDNLHQHLLAEA
ncbi:hypothetical protein D1007_15070 [Hordeum vulgare]|nr:hypothetical protein D1007_15070 [Hordeum vulgare]